MGPLYEKVTQHPEVFAIACVSWIAIGIWIVALVGWTIQGDVDFLFGFCGVAAALVLGYLSFMPPTPASQPFIALGVVLTVIVFPLLRKSLNERALVLIDVEAIEDAYEMLRMKPENSMTRFKLAKLLFGRNQVVPALAIGADALKDMPEKHFTDEHRLYARWRRQNPHANVADHVRCMECGHANPASAIFCERCHKPYLLDFARGAWVGRQFARKLLAGWVAGILALAGIPLAAQLPPGAAIVAVVAIMIAAGVMVWLALRASHEGANA